MVEFFETLIETDDFETLLGDLYQPVCAGLVFTWGVVAFAGVVSMFNAILAAIFQRTK